MTTFAVTLTGPEARAMRERRGYSVATMAEKVGVKPGTIRAIETGSEMVSRLVENAIRHIDLTGGPELEAVCAACDGLGTVADPSRPFVRHARRVRCATCDGQGVESAEPARVVA